MAIYHLVARTGSRDSGQSARAKYEYISREGKYAKTRAEAHIIMSGNMPAWAIDNPIVYWKAADEYERVNGRLYKQIEFSLPVELSKDEQEKIALEFAEHLTKKENLPYTFAIHIDDSENPHCHIMISERVNDMIERSPETWFRRANTKSPTQGGAKKTVSLKPEAWLLDTREAWAVMANAALELTGHSERIDHKSLADQGVIDREAQVHEGRNPVKKKENQVIKAKNARRKEIDVQVENLEDELAVLRIVSEQRQAEDVAADIFGKSLRDPIGEFCGNRLAASKTGVVDFLLADFSMRKTKDGYLRFAKVDDVKTTSFIDYGNRIKVYADDDKTLLAGLQVAAQKWGTVQLQGTDEFKERCILLAEQHGIKIYDPARKKTDTVQQPSQPSELIETEQVVPQQASQQVTQSIEIEESWDWSDWSDDDINNQYESLSRTIESVHQDEQYNLRMLEAYVYVRNDHIKHEPKKWPKWLYGEKHAEWAEQNEKTMAAIKDLLQDMDVDLNRFLENEADYANLPEILHRQTVEYARANTAQAYPYLDSLEKEKERRDMERAKKKEESRPGPGQWIMIQIGKDDEYYPCEILDRKGEAAKVQFNNGQQGTINLDKREYRLMSNQEVADKKREWAEWEQKQKNEQQRPKAQERSTQPLPRKGGNER